MKNITLYIVLFLLVSMLGACKSSEQVHFDDEVRMSDPVVVGDDGRPAFINTPPIDTSEYLYASDSHISSRRDMARRQAVLKANTNMASKLSSKVEALDQIFQEDVSDGDRDRYSAAFTLASRQITSSNLTGTALYQSHCDELENSRIECYVLVRMPVGAARETLNNALSRDQELYIRFKESRAFDELQHNLERLGMD